MTPMHTTRRRRVLGTLATLFALLALASPLSAAAAAWSSYPAPADCSPKDDGTCEFEGR